MFFFGGQNEAKYGGRCFNDVLQFLTMQFLAYLFDKTVIDLDVFDDV